MEKRLGFRVWRVPAAMTTESEEEDCVKELASRSVPLLNFERDPVDGAFQVAVTPEETERLSPTWWAVVAVETKE